MCRASVLSVRGFVLLGWRRESAQHSGPFLGRLLGTHRDQRRHVLDRGRANSEDMPCLEMANEQVKTSVLRDDVEEGGRVLGGQLTDVECDTEVQCIRAGARYLDVLRPLPHALDGRDDLVRAASPVLPRRTPARGTGLALLLQLTSVGRSRSRSSRCSFALASPVLVPRTRVKRMTAPKLRQGLCVSTVRGYRGHAQKVPPAFAPRLALFTTRVAPHFGQMGAISRAGAPSDSVPVKGRSWSW